MADRQCWPMAGMVVVLSGNWTMILAPLGTMGSVLNLARSYPFFWRALSLFWEARTSK